MTEVSKMIRDRSRYGVALLTTLAILVGEFLSFSEPSWAQTKQCSAQQIENNIKNLPTNPTLVDTLTACGSGAVPILTRYLETSPRDRSIELFGEIADRRLLVIVTLGKMGTRAASSTKVLLNLMGNSASSIDLDKVILYTLWQINDVPTRNLIVSNLLAVVETPEKRLNAAAKIDYIYRDILKTKTSLVYAQIVTTSLTQIISENKNNLETRSQALSLLKNFDLAQAQKIAKQYPNIVGSSDTTVNSVETNQDAVVTGDANHTRQNSDTSVSNRAKGRSSDSNTGTSVRTNQTADVLGDKNTTVQDSSTKVENSRRTPRQSSQQINGSNNSPTVINLDPVKGKTKVHSDVDNPADRLGTNVEIKANKPADRPREIKKLLAVCRDPLKQEPVIKIVFGWKCK
jgi:hypothetical protein